MDININVKMDGDTTKAIALLAEAILSAGSAFASVESGSTSAAPAATEAPGAETPPKRTRKSRAKPVAAVETPAAEKVETASAAPEVPAPVKTTRDTVRKAAGAFIEAGNDREEVKGWLAGFGAESITTLEEKHLPTMLGHLTA